jgi:hypothetical protein
MTPNEHAPVSRALVKQLSTFTENWAEAKPIRTHTDYRLAVKALSWIRRVRLDIEESFKEMKAAANATRASVIGQEKKWVGQAKPLEEALTQLIVRYDQQRAEIAKEAAVAALKIPSKTSLMAYSELATPPEGYHTLPRLTVVVTDKTALISAVAEGAVESEALTVNTTYLRKQAEAQGALINVPGIRIDKKFTIVTHDG